MATKTKNYELIKPECTEFYDVDVFNTNVDKLDEVLRRKSDDTHLHDDRYYTETETDEKLLEKSDISHLHDGRYYTKNETDQALGTKSNADHIHDNRYYTETEMDGKLGEKVDKISGKQLSTNDYTTIDKDKLGGVEAGANKYLHPVNAGNKHVPVGGAVDQYLKWAADGSATWAYLSYKLVTGESPGLVPTLPGNTGAFFRGDGQWAVPPDTKYTLSSFGLTATAAELNFCDGVESSIQTQLNGKAPTGHAHAGVYEPAFSKNNAFNKNFGTVAGTVCEGNDSRLSNARPASGGDADTVDGKHAADLQNYNNLSNKPSSFPPSGHTHTRSQITDFPSSLPAAGGNADTVDGFHASPVAGAKSSIVTTDPNGYITAGYINTNVSEENPAIGDFMVINSAKDGYMRKATLAHVKAQLGAMPPDAHYHDDRYYTESEVNSLLSGKVDTSDGRLSNARPASDVYAWAKASAKPGYGWGEISEKPSTFAPSGHGHSEGDITGGISQSINGYANYRVLPGGLKIQYGRTLVYTASNQNLDYTLTLPIAFSGAKDRIYVAGSLMNSAAPWENSQINTHVVISSLSQLRFVNISGLNPSAQYELRWVAIGY